MLSIKKTASFLLAISVALTGIIPSALASDGGPEKIPDPNFFSWTAKVPNGGDGVSEISTLGAALRATIGSGETIPVANAVPGEIIVKFKSGKIDLRDSWGESRAMAFSDSRQLDKWENIDENNIAIMKLRQWESVEDAVGRLRLDDAVEYVQPNYRYFPTMTAPGDPDFAKLWGMKNTWQAVNGIMGTSGVDMQWLDAMDIFTGATAAQSQTGTIVAVIDYGVGYNHPDLANQMWDGTACKDENGNFLWGCLHGYDFENRDKNPLPEKSSHGTHIAGTIAAQMNNGQGLAGVNPNAKIMAIKSSLTTSEIIKAINFAKHNGARVINASFGGVNFDQAQKDTIDQFPGLVIASAGNCGNINTYASNGCTSQNQTLYPAAFDSANVISVANTNQNDQLSSSSNYGATSVDVGAPGTNVYSSIVDSTVMTEDFESYSPGSAGGFVTDTGNNWGVGNDGSSKVIYSDYFHLPYATGAFSLIEKGVDLGDAAIGGATLDFTIWCDTPYTWRYNDFVQTAYSTGSEWVGGEAYNEESIEPSGRLWTDRGYTGYYMTATEDISAYKSPNFHFWFAWTTDDTIDNHYGCTVDNVSISKYSDGSDAKYGFMNGTSMAAPQVAGLASLAWSYRPDLTYADIKAAILNNGDPVNALNGKTVTGKRINAYRTMASLTNPKVRSLKIYKDPIRLNQLADGTWSQPFAPFPVWEAPIWQGNVSSYDLRIDYSPDMSSSGSVSSPTGNFFSGSVAGTWTGAAMMSSGGVYTVSVRGVGEAGVTGDWTASVIKIDGSGPDAPALLSPGSGQYVGSGATVLLWNVPNDIGVGMYSGSYAYVISDSPTLSPVTQMDTVSVTGATVTGLSDGTKYWQVVSYDLLGNTGSLSGTGTFVKDSVAPNAPTNIVLNGNATINASTAANVALYGSGQLADVGFMVRYYVILGGHMVLGRGTLGGSGSFSIPGIDVSRMSDGLLSVSVTITDTAGNESPAATVLVTKDALPPNASVSFPSGTYANSTGTTLVLSVEEPVSYSLSGADIVQSLTGTLTGIVNLSVTLSGSDGPKTVTVYVSDLGGNAAAHTGQIILDTLAPTLSVSSHSHGQRVSGAYATLTGSSSDANGIFLVNVGGQVATGTGAWTGSVALTGGTNAIALRSRDVAMNAYDTSFSLIRISELTGTASTSIANGTARIDFATDLSGTGVVKYGTGASDLNFSATGTAAGTGHSVRLGNLMPMTRYYYSAYGVSGGYVGKASDVASFVTPPIIYVNTVIPPSYTGSVYFGDATGSGLVFQASGTIDIRSDENSGSVVLPANRFRIVASGGTWDGLVAPPTAVPWSGSIVLEGYSRIYGATYKIGSPDVSLTFSGGMATVKLPVDSSYEGRELKILRSENGQVSFVPIATCTVNQSMCVFQTDGFSVFALASPSDSNPDDFVLMPLVGVEPSATFTSNDFTLTGINIPAAISITVGQYNVNSGSYTSASGFVSQGDVIRVQVASSASYSTITSAILTIGGASARYSVTTKPDPNPPVVVSSGGGGGGGGGGGSSAIVDNCPSGDTSWSVSDSLCTPHTATSSGTAVSTGTGMVFNTIQLSRPVSDQFDTSGSGSVTNSKDPKPLVNSTITPNSRKMNFSDIGDSFAKDDIKKLFEMRAIKGYPDGTFRPNDKITRAEFLAITFRALDIAVDENAKTDFTDIPAEAQWMVGYVAKAKELGIVQGQVIDGKLKFRPNDGITRAEALAILLKTKKISVDENAKTDFADIPAEAQWMVGYVAKAKELGIVQGQVIDGKLKFRPNDGITRAEASRIVVKAIGLEDGKKSGTGAAVSTPEVPAE